MQITLPSRPDAKETTAYDLRNDEWTLVYSRRCEFVDSIEVHNLGSQSIFKSPTKNPAGENYETIAPSQSQDENLDPKEIWVRRSSPDTNPKVKVTVRWYTADQLERLSKMRKHFEG